MSGKCAKYKESEINIQDLWAITESLCFAVRGQQEGEREQSVEYTNVT